MIVNENKCNLYHLNCGHFPWPSADSSAEHGQGETYSKVLNQVLETAV